LRSFL
jgi:hypothetical protein